MPVSNPSEFPPHRAGDQIIGIESGENHVGARVFLAGQQAGNNSTITDMTVIGNLAASAGITDILLTGIIAIGPEALKSILTADGAGTNIAIGLNALTNLVNGGSNIAIGANALASADLNNNNTVIGDNAGQFVASAGINPLHDTVIIGSQACKMSAGHGSVNGCVIIGAETLGQALSGNINMTSSVIIGQACYNSNTFSSSAQNIIAIGQGIDGGSGDGSIYIGGGINATGKANVSIGQEIPNCGAQNNVTIGDHAKAIGDNSVILGSLAGNFEIAGNLLIIETGEFGVTTGQNNRLIKGSFGVPDTTQVPGLILGNSSVAAGNDTFPTGAENIVGIVNGVIGSTNPVGGGYFYVSAGALHWVSSTGIDTLLAP